MAGLHRLLRPVAAALLLTTALAAQVPGSQVPGSQVPGSQVPGSQVPIVNPGFEDGLTHWRLSRTGGGVHMHRDGERPGSGQYSLRLEAAAEGTESTVRSEPVRLAVGQLYRLSGWIRTEGVKVDREARYPTALGACLSMESFPFTNASPQVAGTSARRVEVLFLAAASQDRVQLHLGRNGRAWGRAWFDDLKLEKVEDIGAFIPLETVRWSGPGAAGPGYRYDMGGWIFVHIEGEPYPRGRQYGELVSAEIVQYMTKVGHQKHASDPAKGWAQVRLLTDALFLRKYDTEYLEEMKGIADGANKAGAKFKGRELDLLDIAALNSIVDADYVEAALHVTPTPLTGKQFESGEEEAERAGKGDHCSSFVATGTATRDGRFVMGQMFMWNGYTGVHWDVMVDVVPAKGHRLVYQTFPGGLHSGSDWYLNGAGLVIGETTVAQTPFNPEGTPQSNRIRKAAQYASSIDEAVRILADQNNGLYTNDWTMADAKSGEGACLLLGTKKLKLWRTGTAGRPADTPGGLKDFIWANNNARDPEVRTEFGPNPENAPLDLAFGTWNRDIAFWESYKELGKGGFDIASAARLMGSSPINRPHACDAKLTTGEMAEKLAFMAHYGKTTQREKWVGGRFIADLPGATPHLTLGYTTFSPVWITERLRAARAAWKPEPAAKPEPKPELGKDSSPWTYPRRLLWSGTVKPAADRDSWFVSGSAAYWQLLRRLPEEPAKAQELLRDALQDAATRHAFFVHKEGAKAPQDTVETYDRYGSYQLPRIRGMFALHQLRLQLGNARFAQAMKTVHGRYDGKPATTAQVLAALSEGAGREVAPLIQPWIARADLPRPVLAAQVAPAGDGFEVQVEITQDTPWPFVAFAELRTAKGARLERIVAEGPRTRLALRCDSRPLALVFNTGGDLALVKENPFTPSNILDDWSRAALAWGSLRTPEVQRSLTLQWREVLAEATTEVLLPARPDAEYSDRDLAEHDLILLGAAADNALVARLQAEGRLPVTFGPGWFRWKGTLHARPDEGLALAFPNPWNPRRTVYLLAANSALQLYHMTRSAPRSWQAWARFKGSEIAAKGYHEAKDATLRF